MLSPKLPLAEGEKEEFIDVVASVPHRLG